MKKKLKILVVLILIPTLFVGCFNYRDINRMTFVTSTIFDKDEQGNVVIYLDCVKSYRSANESSDKGRRLVYKGIGKTVTEALGNINVSSSFKLNYTQCKAYIFTEDAARDGVKKYLDMMNKNQEFLVRQYAFVYYGDTESLIKTVADDEEYLGLYLNDLVLKSKDRPRVVVANINDYLIDRLEGENVSILGAIELKKDALESRVKLQGGAIIQNDKLVGKLDITQGLTYNLLKHNLRTGTLEARNPQNPESYVSFQILKSDVKTDIHYTDGKINLTKSLEMDVSIAESQDRMIISDDMLRSLELQLENNIKDISQQIFNQYKLKEIDLLNIRNLMSRHYPKVILDDYIKNSTLEVNIKVNIEGSSKIKETL